MEKEKKSANKRKKHNKSVAFLFSRRKGKIAEKIYNHCIYRKDWREIEGERYRCGKKVKTDKSSIIMITIYSDERQRGVVSEPGRPDQPSTLTLSRCEGSANPGVHRVPTYIHTYIQAKISHVQ